MNDIGARLDRRRELAGLGHGIAVNEVRGSIVEGDVRGDHRRVDPVGRDHPSSRS